MRVPFLPLRKTTQPSDFLLQQQQKQQQQQERIDNDSTNLAPSNEMTDYDTVSGDVSSKGPSGDRHLDVHTRPTILRPSADSLFSNLSLYAGNFHPTLRSPSPVGQPLEPAAPPRRTLRTMLWTAWLQSKGMLMVILSQFFGASMNVMTQMLEKDGSHGKAMHPFQILFARMSITTLASYLYMWYTGVPHPFGTREVRWLLVLRAVGGFFGVFGMYYSLLYMPLSEATVLTFLAPIATCYACSLLMPNEPFTRKQQLAGLISLLGVVLIARPFSGTDSESPSSAEMVPANRTATTSPSETLGGETVDTYHHLLAILVALIGVLGATCAFTAIRAIGTRAHALVSVTYFSTYTTIISLVAMLAVPSVSFRLPENLIEWVLLVGLGVAGFSMQYLLTAGLAYKPPAGSPGQGTRATSMVYTQTLFALFYDKVVMNSSPSAMSWAGSGLILGSAIYVAIVRESNKNTTSDGQVPADGETETRRKDVRDGERDVEEGQGLLAASEPMELEERTEHSQ
ncbi:hypothetical protein VTN77DRAFT_7122 [Rasamsonia byssochlamydoides]|uniref:uncharacterized protein n=1 Tax=Rasamsonia byssochlamydoides TaxID=89139 RepID=UPI003743895E